MRRGDAAERVLSTQASRRRWRRGACCVLGLLLAGAPALRCQGPREAGIVQLFQAVKDAQSDRLALLVASHPDDRWVLPATWLRFMRGWRVAVLLFTRGRGGQNSLGPQTGDELGQLRTLEAEACAAHMGAKIYYLNRPDNGFSRSAEEALAQWSEEQSAVDAARLLRKIRPDLVITTHHPAESHGHDLALLKILRQALVLSADATHDTAETPAYRIPTFLRAVAPGEEELITVSVPMDTRDELRGRTYRQLAYAAMQEHRSQMPLQEMDALFGSFLELMPEQIGSQPLHKDLDPPVDDLLQASAAHLPIEELVWLRDEGFAGLPARRLDRPALARHCVEILRRLAPLEVVRDLDLRTRLGRRKAALEQILRQAAGVQVFMEVPNGVEAAPGDELPLHIWIRNEGAHRLSKIRIDPIGGGALRVSGGSPPDMEPQSSLPIQAYYVPAELSALDLRHMFTAETFVPPLRLRFAFELAGQSLEVVKLIPTSLQPAVKVEVTPRTLLLPSGTSRARFVVGLERKTRKPVDLRLRVNAPAGMTVRRGVREVNLAAAERFRELDFELNATHVPPSVSTMHVHAGDASLRVRVHKVDVVVPPQLRVGLVPGVDATIHEILQSLVGDDRLHKFETTRPLPILDPGRLDTVVVDTRALRAAQAQAGFARLLEYVKAGGRVVVFYHKDQEFNLAASGFRGAPYPLVIGKGRVTREDAPVRLLQPEHPLFRTPNKVRVQDWDGWYQERGLYFPAEYDERFVELLAMNDPDQPEERGALLYTKYGKGDYIYCALALHRQLKNRHAGACRIFANLISPAAPR